MAPPSTTVVDFRAAQFIRLFPNQLSPERALRRIFAAHGFTEGMITPLGRGGCLGSEEKYEERNKKKRKTKNRETESWTSLH